MQTAANVRLLLKQSGIKQTFDKRVIPIPRLDDLTNRNLKYDTFLRQNFSPGRTSETRQDSYLQNTIVRQAKDGHANSKKGDTEMKKEFTGPRQSQNIAGQVT